MRGRLWSLRRCPIVNCNRFRSVRGPGGCRVGCGRLRPRSVVNCNRCRSVRGSGGCVVGCGRLRRSSVVNCNRSLSVRLVVAWSAVAAVVAAGRLWRCAIVSCYTFRSVVWWKVRTGDFLCNFCTRSNLWRWQLRTRVFVVTSVRGPIYGGGS